MMFWDLIETHCGEKNYVAICSKFSEKKWLDCLDYNVSVFVCFWMLVSNLTG